MRRSLRQRIAFSLTCFSLLVAVPIILVGEWINERAEQELWKAMLSAEIADIDALGPRSGASRHGVFHTYVWQNELPEQARLIPPEILKLSPGVSDNIQYSGREWAVLLRVQGGVNTAVGLDITDLESEEATLSIWASATALLGLILLLLALNWLAKRAVDPVTQLATQLKTRMPTATEPFTTSFQEREIVEVVAALNGFIVRIHEHVQREKQFVETMSHELRTPLAVILGALEVLEQRAVLEPREAAAVGRVRQTTKELLELSQVLLFLAHGNEKRVAKEPVLLLPLLTNSLAAFRAEFTARRLAVNWVLADDIAVLGARPLCAIVVNNLIRNCCDHASDGIVEISLDAKHLAISNTMNCNAASGCTASTANWRGNIGMGLGLINRVCEQLGWSFKVSGEGDIFAATICFEGINNRYPGTGL